MGHALIDRLLKENETIRLREKRAADRRPFVRPVTIRLVRSREEIHEAFSRDISSMGLGVIGRQEWPQGTRAELKVHAVVHQQPFMVTADARWTESFGSGWYLTGWRFVDA